MAKSKKVFVGVKGEPIGIESGSKGNTYLQGAPKKVAVEERVNPAKLISRLNYPVQIKYGEETINVSPRAKLTIADETKLGKLPVGIVVKKI